MAVEADSVSNFGAQAMTAQPSICVGCKWALRVEKILGPLDGAQ